MSDQPMASQPVFGQRRANVVGVGLIGGSIGLALRRAGWHVSGADIDASRVSTGLDLGVLDQAGLDADAEITFLAVPVLALAEVAAKALAETSGWVTDTGGVKTPVSAAVTDPRFVPGHPMAGSEHLGVEGADADLFAGAVWVLTPAPDTDDRALAGVRAVVASLGAEPVTISPADHDALVAVVSHVPHLTAATLMGMADERGQQHAALLRLAAGGFRDMTRIAAGDPGIWIDVCAQNADAIVAALDHLIESLDQMRRRVAEGDAEGLLGELARAQRARRNLPGRVAAHPEALAEIRLVIPDQPGVLATVTATAAELGISVLDLEIRHSAEGDRGLLALLVDADHAERLRAALADAGFRPTLRVLE